MKGKPAIFLLLASILFNSSLIVSAENQNSASSDSLNKSVSHVGDSNNSIPKTSPAVRATFQKSYPNPFGHSGISVRYTLSETCLVDYKIYSINGTVVHESTEGMTPPGVHAIDLSIASGVSSGIYFIRITACDSSWAQRIVLIK